MMKGNIVKQDPTSELANYVVKEIVKSVLNKSQKTKNPVERWCDYTVERLLNPRRW